MARLQQQGPYRGSHQHSASDPASLRDPATLALLTNNMQAAFAAGQMYGPGMVPPNVALFTQFYNTPDAYSTSDPNLMNRIQPQYTGQYGVGHGRNIPPSTSPLTSQITGSTQGGNNSNNAANRKQGLYKTELCRSWEEKGSCRYGSKCQFAHGEDELRQVQRHPKVSFMHCILCICSNILVRAVQDRDLQGMYSLYVLYLSYELNRLFIDILGIWHLSLWQAVLLHPH